MSLHAPDRWICVLWGCVHRELTGNALRIPPDVAQHTGPLSCPQLHPLTSAPLLVLLVYISPSQLFCVCVVSWPLHGLASPQGRSDQHGSRLTHQQHIQFADPLTSRTLQLSLAEWSWKVGCLVSPPALHTALHGPSAVLPVQLMCTECQQKSGSVCSCLAF